MEWHKVSWRFFFWSFPKEEFDFAVCFPTATKGTSVYFKDHTKILKDTKLTWNLICDTILDLKEKCDLL